MKPSDIERLIHICAKLNVARIKLKSGEVELSLDFASVFKDEKADPLAGQIQVIPQSMLKGKTIGEAALEYRERIERERQGKQPGTYMSDIELAMNPPRDLREAMDAAPLDIVVPGEPGIQVTEKEPEVAPAPEPEPL